MTMKPGATDPQDLEVEDVHASFISAREPGTALSLARISSKQQELEDLASELDFPAGPPGPHV